MGSSPLTRGKRFAPIALTEWTGLIPAHAGKTSFGEVPGPAWGAHPRSRGENAPTGRPRPSGPGSSPLTRGKRARRAWSFCPLGLIPAHAGKTSLWLSIRSALRAHPRSRGENLVAQYVGSRDVGSSPLTRGKPELTPLEIDDLRLIPAHAGKTRGQESRHEGSPAHPRSRGENQAAKPLGRKDLGSSPLTRGKLPEAHRLLGGKRLIPAHAGKTRATRRTRYRMRAHPRSRGENPSAAAAPASTCGSSPLTRGKPRLGCVSSSPWRLIPAHAGKTSR